MAGTRDLRLPQLPCCYHSYHSYHVVTIIQLPCCYHSYHNYHVVTMYLPCIYHIVTMQLPFSYHSYHVVTIVTMQLPCSYYVVTIQLPCVYHVVTIVTMYLLCCYLEETSINVHAFYSNIGHITALVCYLQVLLILNLPDEFVSGYKKVLQKFEGLFRYYTLRNLALDRALLSSTEDLVFCFKCS